ncbi:MAG: DUF2442 domain-containing protein [Acidimicrobiales bacterium]
MKKGRPAPVPRVTAAEVIPPYSLRVTFDDGLVREVDLAEELWGPMFEPLKDPAVFALVKVDHEIGTVVWPNGADLAPEMLHGDHEPAHRRPQRQRGIG